MVDIFNMTIKDINDDNYLKEIKCNNINYIKKIIDENVNINLYPIFILAIRYNAYDIVILCIKNCVNIHQQNEYALMLATRIGNYKIVSLLLNLDIDLHIQPYKSLAEYKKYTDGFELFKIIQQYNADGTPNEYALLLSVYYNKLDVLKLLIDHGANINNDCILKIAISRNHLDIVKFLIEMNIYSYEIIKNALFYSMNSEFLRYSINMFDYLLSKCIFDEIKYEIFISAISQYNFEIIQYCLDHNVDINFENSCALLKAIKLEDCYESIKFLVKRGANITNHIMKIAKNKNDDDLMHLMQYLLKSINDEI